MEKTNRQILIAISLFFLALVGPLLLIPLEKFLPYPYIIEEIAKLLLVLLVLQLTGKIFQLKLAIFIAFLFAFSESFFYLTNFIEAENLTGFIQRFFLAGILHIFTILVILIPSQKKGILILPAAGIAMLAHYLFNQIVMSLL